MNNSLTTFTQSLSYQPRTLQTMLNKIGPLPVEALLLGVASDGLPVLLNLHDPVPGPILVAGDSGSGKTALLKMVALAACLKHTSAQLQFGVITDRQSEWSMFESFPHNLGILPVSEEMQADDFIQSLYIWAHQNDRPKQSILLMIDRLTSVRSMDVMTLMQLRWLLLRGPSRRIWPIITLNSADAETMRTWLLAFRTRIFSKIQSETTARYLNGFIGNLHELEAGNQFTLREGLDQWCRFWIPT